VTDIIDPRFTQAPPRAIRVKTSAGWADLAIQGPQGVTGAQGPQGATGAGGATGPPGPGVAAGGTTGQALVKKTNADYDTQWALAGADLVYWGAYAAGNYKDGDIVIGSDGIAYMAVRPTTAAPKPWATTQYPGKPTYGTTLPASPVDGQEAILVDNVTNPSYQWRFRYNAQSSSAYRWEYVGGASMLQRVETDEGTTAVWPAWVPLSGPSLTIPRAGDYTISFGSRAYVVTPAAAGGQQAELGLVIAGAIVVTLDYYGGSGGAASFSTTVAVHQAGSTRRFGLAASTTIQLGYGSNATASPTAHFSGRFLEITPVRVA
jgi:hypothetical protein